MNTKEIIEVLKRSSLCNGLKDEDMIRLLKKQYAKIRVFKKGERIFNEGDPPQYLLLLLSGNVIIAKETVSGKRMVLTQIRNAGELFGEIYAFMGLPCYSMYAETMEQTTILLIEQSIFSHNTIDSNEEITILRNNLLTVFAQKAYLMNQKLQVLGSASVREKIVRFLIEQQNDSKNIKLHLSREEMADWLNVTRPSLSRELGNMAKEGIIRINGCNLVILDQEKLEKYL